MINTLITEEQIKKVIKINNCLEPEHWNKGMYDAFMLGVGLGKCNAFDKLEKEIRKCSKPLVHKSDILKLISTGTVRCDNIEEAQK